MTRILVVDDEPQIRKTLSVSLRARDFTVAAVGSGEEALEAVAASMPDLVLLDLGLPGIGGRQVVQRLRTWTDVPVIILSVRNEQHEKVAALDAGADDYLTKPFGVEELLARIRAALRRRSATVDTPLVRTRHFELDLTAKRATVAGAEVRLTPLEWGLVEQLVRSPGRLVGRRELLQAVWGPEYERETNYLRVHLANVRRKLEPEPSRPRYFVTEAGMGYRFQPDPET